MKYKILIAAILSSIQTATLAEISTDGTVGAAVNLSASNGQFTIGQELGSLSGSNLFHSFQQFNINTGESATFTGNNAIQNVISRVTGGNQSTIDGILQSQIGAADFFFINPAGVVFGENASIDVPAAFHVSTAGELRFADGSSFSALNPQASTLTVAAPEGFGFSQGQRGGLQIIGGQLSFKPGTDVSLSANSLVIAGIEQDSGEIKRARLNVGQVDSAIEQGIHLNLTSVDSATSQTIPLSELAETASGGSLLIENSVIDVSGNGFGHLAVRAGGMVVHNSLVFADNTGIQPMSAEDGINIYANSMQLDNSLMTNDVLNEGNAGNVSVTVNNAMQVLNGSQIRSETFSIGNAGNVMVKAGQLIINGQEQGNTGFTGIYSESFSEMGNAGNVLVIVDDALQVLNGGQISSETISGGNAGNVTVETGQLTIDRQGNENDTGIFSNTEGTGYAGNVLVTADAAIQVLNGGQISSETFSAGNAGNVTIEASQLTIDRQGSGNLTGIFAFANLFENLRSTGNSGDIEIIVKEAVQVLNGGEVSSFTLTEGDAGNVTIEAGRLIIDRQDSDRTTGISSEGGPDSTGKPGNVLIAVNEAMQVLNGGRVSTFAFNAREGGSVTVEAGQLTIDSQGSELLTGISSNAISGTGNAGTVLVEVRETMQVLNGGQLSSSTFTEGNAGSITVKAEQLTIDRQESENLTGIISNAESGIGNAGTVLVSVSEAMLILNGGQVSSSTVSEGDAGSVSVEAEQLTIDGQDGISSISGIFSEARMSTGNAGTVLISVNEAMQVMNGGRISSSTFTEGNAGSVTVEAEQLIIDGQGSEQITGISSDTNLGNGNAGTVSIAVNETMQVLNGGRVSSFTLAQGDAGNVTVKAGQLTIDGQDSVGTGIFSDARLGTGNAGTVSIAVNEAMQVLNGGRVSSFASSQGRVGSVSVTATEQIQLIAGFISIGSFNQSLQSSGSGLNSTPAIITIDTPVLSLGQNSSIDATANGGVNAAPIEINVSDTLDVVDSQIATAAFNGDGAAITVNADNYIRLKNSLLTTSVFGNLNGNGGDITLTTPVLVLDTGFIQANTAADLASGGDINLNVSQLVASGDTLLRGGSEPLEFDSNQANFNVIQAASPTGVSGTINITSPELNIVGALTGVNIPELDITRIGQDPCASSQENSLKSLGHGGVPVFQHGENYLPISRVELPKKERKKSEPPQINASVVRSGYKSISVECSKMRTDSLS